MKRAREAGDRFFGSGERGEARRASRGVRRVTRAVAAMGALLASASAIRCGGDSFEAGGGDTDAATSDGAAADGGGSGDAATVDGASLDGTSAHDALLPDGATPDSALPDGAPAPLDCASPPIGTLFCADFDHVNQPKDKWDLQVQYGGAQSALDPLVFVSPPNGFATNCGASTNAIGTSLQSSFTTSAALVEYSFSAYVKLIDGLNESTITAARLALGSQGGRDFLLDLLIDNKGVRVHQDVPLSDGGSIAETDQVASNVPLNKWVRIRMELDRGVMPSVRVFVDGLKVVDKPPVTSNIHGSSVEIDVGMIFVQPPTAGNAITYDDVLLRGL